MGVLCAVKSVLATSVGIVWTLAIFPCWEKKSTSWF